MGHGSDSLSRGRNHTVMQHPSGLPPLVQTSAMDAQLLNRALRSFNNWWRLNAWHDLISRLTGCDVKITVYPLELIGKETLSEQLTPDIIAALLCQSRNGQFKIAVELDKRLASCLIDRVLGGEAGQNIPEPLTSFSDTEQGIFAYTVAHLLLASHTADWKLHSVLTQPSTMLAISNDPNWFLWSAHVQLGSDEGYARVHLPQSALQALLQHGSPLPPVENHSQVPLEMVVRLTHCSMTGETIGSLKPQDIVLLGRTWSTDVNALDPWATEDLQLHLDGNPSYTWTACSEGDGFITITSITQETPMPHAKLNPPSTSTMDVETIASIPIAVSVELGRFKLKASEVSALIPGQVVQTGLSLGSKVVLRAGESLLATGELVNVDGELGVRILTR